MFNFCRDFIKRTAELVQSNGGLYVADEVQTGFGRTGSNYWGFQNHDAMPDIVTMAKGMGNGFPMAAVVTTKEIAGIINLIYKVLNYSCSKKKIILDLLGQALYFNTFGGNPMACAVGSAVLDVIDEEKLQENCANVGTYFLNELAKLRDEFEIVGDVRGKGLMIGIEMVQDKVILKTII
jgi:alanine-glyoxylate transaminase / (R)-3-amino-2-methylpropionate-pyruvate transaminase